MCSARGVSRSSGYMYPVQKEYRDEMVIGWFGGDGVGGRCGGDDDVLGRCGQAGLCAGSDGRGDAVDPVGLCNNYGLGWEQGRMLDSD